MIGFAKISFSTQNAERILLSAEFLTQPAVSKIENKEDV